MEIPKPGQLASFWIQAPNRKGIERHYDSRPLDFFSNLNLPHTLPQVVSVAVDFTCSDLRSLRMKACNRQRSPHIKLLTLVLTSRTILSMSMLRLSWYYTATTVTSIGYGDISPLNANERRQHAEMWV